MKAMSFKPNNEELRRKIEEDAIRQDRTKSYIMNMVLNKYYGISKSEVKPVGEGS